MQKLHLPDCNNQSNSCTGTYFRGHTREFLSPLAGPLFKMCSETREVLTTGRVWSTDHYLHSGGVFKDTVPCRWRIESSRPWGLFPKDLSEGQKAHIIFRMGCCPWRDISCRTLKLPLLILGGVSFIKSLGTDSHKSHRFGALGAGG